MTEWLVRAQDSVALRILAGVVVSVFALWLAERVPHVLEAVSARPRRLLAARARRLGIGTIEEVSGQAVETTFDTLTGLLRIVLTAALFYGWLLVLAYVVDAHHTYVRVILDPLESSGRKAGNALLGFVPNLVVLVLIIAFGRVLGSVIRTFTGGIATGRVQVFGMDASVATPTRRILTFFLWVAMAIVAAPYLPGSDSKAFQAVSVALGILVSLGSSSLVSNLIAGLTITYSRAYRVGDRVRIGDYYGDITALGAVTTRLRTIYDEEVVLPNGFAHSSPLTNFSRYAPTNGVRVHTQVTIGYDAPYTIVEALLVKAALATPGVASDPLPFVLQPTLEDYYVRYEICAVTRLPNELHLIQANLHRKILDVFFEAGVEICSPAFTAIRDGNSIAMPREALRSALDSPTLEPERKADLADAAARGFRLQK